MLILNDFEDISKGYFQEVSPCLKMRGGLQKALIDFDFDAGVETFREVFSKGRDQAIARSPIRTIEVNFEAWSQPLDLLPPALAQLRLPRP